MSNQTIAFNYCEGVNVIINNGIAAVNYDIEKLMQLSDAEQKAIQRAVKSMLISEGLIEQ